MKQLQQKIPGHTLCAAVFFLSIGVFIVEAVRWSVSAQAFWEMCVFHASFTAIFGVLYVLCRHIKKKNFMEFFSGLAFWICIGFLCATVLRDVIWRRYAPVTNPFFYGETLKRYRENYQWASGLSHFPSRVPSSAQKIRFSFAQESHFNSQLDHMQLRYTTTAGEAAELYERFSRAAESFLPAGDVRLMRDAGISCFNITDTPGSCVLPTDYEILVFPRSRDDWFIRGVAISKQRNEIVYWFERE